uniref:Uncharacterized protein n=1 Tax=Oryza sativa subsp. japonica TaxID=39947 RepID=Q2QMF1_ORYSJ|nr:hypothetical protein LOC_Os12g41360 [Oryza sativa Japonica Group]
MADGERAGLQELHGWSISREKEGMPVVGNRRRASLAAGESGELQLAGASASPVQVERGDVRGPHSPPPPRQLGRERGFPGGQEREDAADQVVREAAQTIIAGDGDDFIWVDV